MSNKFTVYWTKPDASETFMQVHANNKEDALQLAQECWAENLMDCNVPWDKDDYDYELQMAIDDLIGTFTVFHGQSRDYPVGERPLLKHDNCHGDP